MNAAERYLFYMMLYTLFALLSITLIMVIGSWLLGE